jgi:hypothetical protein
MTIHGEQEPVNPYLALRQAKIARNQARLEELGLAKPWSSMAEIQGASSALPVAAKRNQRAAITTAIIIPERRSLRKREVPVRYTEHNNLELMTRKSRKVSPEIHTEVAIAKATIPLTIDELKEMDASWKSSLASQQPLPSLPVSTSSSPRNNSARDMSVNVHQLLFGDGPLSRDGCLGKPMSLTGKAHVMQETVRRAVGSSQSYRVHSAVSFNKYSGVQAWGNNVFFLWINLGAPHSDVRNEFLHQGRQVTWFGGSRMHDATNVIVQLVRAGLRVAKTASIAQSGLVDGRAVEEEEETAAIVLWCREYDPIQKSFGAYVCLGRLSVRRVPWYCLEYCCARANVSSLFLRQLVSYDPASRPLAFVWQLLDYDYLVSNADTSNTFRIMTGVASHR